MPNSAPGANDGVSKMQPVITYLPVV